MRILIGIACLILVFGVSTLWHRSEMKSFRAQAAFGEEQVVQAAPARQHAAGWGEVVVGTPSGAEPLYVEPVDPPARARRLTPPGYRSNGGRRDSASVAETDDATLAEPGLAETTADWELVVGAGDVLSKIVKAHYGRVSPKLEQRLAEYNGLSSPDKLRLGQTLYLPLEEVLIDEPK